MAAGVSDALWPGRPYPLGAHWDGLAVNFAPLSESAERVELCLFDRTGRNEVHRLALREQKDQVWHGYLPQARPGPLYGYRVHGPYQPRDGHRWRSASPAPATCTTAAAAGPTPASTSSPCTTASRWPTWRRTTTSTTRPTASTTATATTTTSPGTAASRARPLRDDSFLLLFNAGSEAVSFNWPAGLAAGPGELLIDTRSVQIPAGVHSEPLQPYPLPGRTLPLFRFARAAVENV